MTNPTRIMLKRSVKGKFVYSVLLSRKALTKITVDALAEKLFKKIKKQKRYLHILLKPNQSGGRIHEIVSQNISLL